jgi:hypothetical protein
MTPVYHTPGMSTPATREGVLALFEGLCGIQNTLRLGAPAQAAIGITPSLVYLLKQHCADDPRFKAVMAEVRVVDRLTLVNASTDHSKPKAAGASATTTARSVRIFSIIARLIGVALIIAAMLPWSVLHEIL